jgi:hypothetical protein
VYGPDGPISVERAKRRNDPQHGLVADAADDQAAHRQRPRAQQTPHREAAQLGQSGATSLARDEDRVDSDRSGAPSRAAPHSTTCAPERSGLSSQPSSGCGWLGPGRASQRSCALAPA